MAYENIRFNKPNMVVNESYFYFLDETKNSLVVRLADGDTAFEYPTNVFVGAQVKSLQYDGHYFWSLQDDGSGFIIKRWEIDNFLCVLKDTLTFHDNSYNNYQSSAFGVEHYITNIAESMSSRSKTIKITEYYDTVLDVDTKMLLGPNVTGNFEEVTISGIVGNTIHLYNTTDYIYTQNDPVSIRKSLFIFNNYYGVSSSEGSLIRVNAYDGSYMSSSASAEYKNVNAATFCRIQNVLPDYPDAHVLMYIKGTNAKLRNMSDLVNIYDATNLSDNFDGADLTLPNSTFWEPVYGNSYILNNKLFSSVTVGTTDEISSNYELVGDFNLQVSGTINPDFVTTSGSYFEHYIKMTFPYTTSSEYKFGLQYDDGVFNLYTSTNDITSHSVPVTSGTSFLFRAERSTATTSFYYKEITASGVVDNDWSLLTSLDLFSSGCKISLGTSSFYSATVSGAYFDNLLYTYGDAIYPSDTLPLYGIMNIDNVRIDQVTVIPVYDITVHNGTMYRLQNEAAYYGTNNSWSTYNYQPTTIRPFIDFITVGADPIILPANGKNVSIITALVNDQYGNPANNRPVTFTDDNSIGFMTAEVVYTGDYNYNPGKAVGVYKAGTDITTVTIEGTVTQYD